MAYRCIHCGGFTGETMEEARATAATEHGVGICVSPWRWCNEGTPHSPHACAAITADEDGTLRGIMSASVEDFCARLGWRGIITTRRLAALDEPAECGQSPRHYKTSPSHARSATLPIS